MFFKLLIGITLGALFTTGFAMEKTICGSDDDRQFSTETRAGRLLKAMGPRAGCSGALIGRTCMVSAGHCYKYLKFAEFNVPRTVAGKIRHPGPEDIYEGDPASVVYKYSGVGKDWAVFRLQVNKVTGRYAGDVQGYYRVSNRLPAIGQLLRITGYGVAAGADRYASQQTHTGALYKTEGKALTYNQLDTTGGNSGSGIIHERSNTLVGIHTNGGCRTNSGYNKGTSVALNKKLYKAIQNCLKYERENL